MGQIGGEKIEALQVYKRWTLGQAEMLEFFAYKHVSRGNCKRRRREAAISEGKKALPIRGSGPWGSVVSPVAVLGFCVWGETGQVLLFRGLKGIKRRRRETAIAEGKKPLTTIGGQEERRKLPQRGLGRSPRNRRDFEHCKPKWSKFWDPVNLTF